MFLDEEVAGTALQAEARPCRDFCQCPAGNAQFSVEQEAGDAPQGPRAAPHSLQHSWGGLWSPVLGAPLGSRAPCGLPPAGGGRGGSLPAELGLGSRAVPLEKVVDNNCTWSDN